MYKYTIVQTDDGHVVYVNLISSLAGRYLSRRPYLINLLEEVLRTVKFHGRRVVVETDMGRNIGRTDIVATNEKDSIYYAQPIKTDIFSRFARNRFPQLSQVLTVVIERDTEGNYEVINTWIGPSSPPFPGDKNETRDSKPYWQSHALVQDAQIIKSKTITKDCPY